MPPDALDRRDRRPGRLVALDVARCLALLGMMAAHVIGKRTAEGDPTVAYAVAGGRSSALFAVLAGVTIAVMSGRTAPVRGRARMRLSAGLLARSLLIALLGLALGSVGSGLAIILAQLGLLIALGVLFLGLGTRPLAMLAACWVVVGPVVNKLLVPEMPPRDWRSPTFGDLADPGQLLSELLVTGTYPVLVWLVYLLAGMAIGRADLTRVRTAVVLIAAGVTGAVAAFGVSRWFTAQAQVREALGGAHLDRAGLLDQLSGGLGGNPPPGGAWQWLLVVAPHSSTPFDLAHTIGCAMAVVGVCLLAVRRLPVAGKRAVVVLFGAGTMTLTLYSLHVVMRTPEVWPSDEPGTYVWHVLVVLAIGAVFVASGRRGPLEFVAGAPGRVMRGDDHVVDRPGPG